MRQASSYVHGVSGKPLLGETVGEFFDRTVQAQLEREAIVCPDQSVRWTWRELGEHVDAIAAGLLACGLQPGERLAIWAQNRSEWTVTQFAAAKAGLILVNINPGARQDELQEQLNGVGAAGLITQDQFKTSDYLGMLAELIPELASSEPGKLQCEAIPTLRLLVNLGESKAPGMLSFAELAQRGDEAHRQQLREIANTIDFDDPVNIQFSSASGGKPAAATLTHHNILNNGYYIGAKLRLSPDDRICIPVPLFHCFGMVMGNMACLAHGSTMIYPGEAFDPEQTLRTIAQERCTGVYGVPAMFIAMLEHESFGEHDLTSLRTGVMAGAPCPIDTMRQVIRDMHMEQVVIGYGMTESSPASFMSDIDDPAEIRVSTVGRILPFTEAKVIDEQGRIVPRGESGELCVRGYNVMHGYWNDAHRTAQIIDPQGWLHTGDLAKLDDDGYCSIVGTIKDMVIRGGENVFPIEVEEFLLQHPAIAEIAVVGVPDPRLGEELCACIRLAEGSELTESEVREFCKGKIAHFKVPRYIRFYEQLPPGAGRALKSALRKQVMAELEIAEPTG